LLASFSDFKVAISLLSQQTKLVGNKEVIAGYMSTTSNLELGLISLF
jgi:hypothetical protein